MARKVGDVGGLPAACDNTGEVLRWDVVCWLAFQEAEAQDHLLMASLRGPDKLSPMSGSLPCYNMVHNAMLVVELRNIFT